MKKKLAKLGLFLSPFGLFIIFSLIWIFLLKPYAINILKNQLPKVNQLQNYAVIKADDLDISLLKLQLSLENINTEFNQQNLPLEPLQIKQIRLQIDPFKLLVGQISVSKIYIEQAKWSYENNIKSNEPSTEIPFDKIFEIAEEIPIDQIILNNAFFNFKDDKENVDLNLKPVQIQLTHKKNAFYLTLKKLNLTSTKSTATNAQIDSDIKLNYANKSSTLDINALHIQTLNSKLTTQAKLIHFEKILLKPEGELSINSDLHFEDIRSIGLALFPQKNRIPAVTGSLKAKGQAHFNGLHDINGNLILNTEQVNIDHFKLGQAQIQTEIKKNQIFINQIDIEHPAGIATLKEIEIEQRPPYNYKALLKIKKFDLHKLFQSINLADIPAGLQANGEARCQGILSGDLTSQCQVQTELQDIWVKPDIKNSLNIVKLTKAELTGLIQLNHSEMQFKSDIHLGKSAGTSQGSVRFNDGFKIQFETEGLNFDDVASLADLNFKGQLKIKGQTQGDSHHGTIDADAEFFNGEIDKFRIGHVRTPIKYEKAQLELKNMIGEINKTQYNGDVHFNFKDSNLSGSLNIPQLNGEDILFALDKRFDIPFRLTGKGNAFVQFSGPFRFWNLNYDLSAKLSNGSILDEGFEQLKINLQSDGQAIHFKQFDLNKSKSSINILGLIATSGADPIYNLTFKSHPLYLQEVDHIMKLSPTLTGLSWIEGQIKGALLDPQLSYNFNIKQLSFENTEYPNSQGMIELNRKQIRFNGQLFGRQIQSDITWPWNENDAYSFKLQVRDLNPLLFLPLISLPIPSNEYYSRINADIDLKSPSRKLKNSDGTIRINDFMLQRGALYLKLSKASQMNFKNGLQSMDLIDLKGEGSSLKVQLLSSSKEEAKLSVGGDLQLKQFQFLVPFAQNVTGRLQAESQILFKNNHFELLGDGEMTDGLVSLKGLPQAIDNINTPIEFSKSKILLSDISAQMGQSEIFGQGQIDIKGSHNINVNLTASAENIELVFPEQITTAGKADLNFFGSWLPYTLKINYKVARGLVEKDFGSETNQGKSTLKASPFLPPAQVQQQAPSLLLDADVDLSQGVIIKNKIIEGEAFGKLKITGSPELPLIAGRIDIKSGSKLIFKDKSFDIQIATIQFPVGAKEINPDIYMTASSHVSEYDINLLVQGAAKNLSIKPTSQPPLSEPDIFSLLALGMTSTKMDQNLSSQTQQEQTGLEIIASQVNQSQVNKKFQEKFGLTVQLAPTVDSTKNIAVPKVVVSKKIQKNLNASYSRPLTGDTQNQEWKLQYLFNPNKSVILNYQNVETNQQDQMRNSNTNETGILGLDFEYKKEFK